MKIKLFNREAISDSYYSNGITRTRLETNEELENRINEYMADKKVSNVQAYGDNIMVTYEGVK
jgi:predicted HTH domain antitoxin